MDESRHLINQQLWKAVKEGDEREVERLLKDKGDPNYKSLYQSDNDTIKQHQVANTSLLMVAADKGQQSIVQLLLKHGARVDDSNSVGWTSLHYASGNDCYEIVQQLIKSGANVDAVIINGQSSLHWAAERGHYRVVQLLIESKAKIDLQDCFGRPSLHWAAFGGHDRVVQLLIESKAKIDLQDLLGEPSLHWAVRSGHDRVVQLLIESKARIDLQDNLGRSSLHWAAERRRDRVVQLLIESKAKIDLQDNYGDTPLHLAARYNMSGAVKVLLANKANPDIKNQEGKRPDQLSFDRRLKEELTTFRFAALYGQGSVPPKVLKLCVLGAAGAGKTTFLEALRKNFLKWLFSMESQCDDPTSEYERTVGINVTTADIPGVGPLSLYDHAGQKQFHKTHGLFFKASNALFLLLLSLVQGGQIRTIQELIDEAQYWLSFLRASLQNEFIPTVIMAASRADYNYPESQQILQRLVSDMQRLFHGKVNITDDSFLLDCRKSRSPEMMKLRGFLAKTRKEYLERTDVRYPRFYEPVTSRLLPELRCKAEEAFMTTGTLITEIKEKECLKQDSKFMDKVVDFLDDTGEVIKVGQFVSINPCWLSQYALGPIIAPEEMKWRAHTVGGRVTKEEAERAINEYLRYHKIKVNVKIDTVLKMLVDLGLAFMLEDGTYMVPARLPPLHEHELSVMWKKEEDRKVYIGRRKLCTSRTSIFSPSTFSLFQSQACLQIDKQARLWRDGIIVSRAESVATYVQCMARMVDPLRAVDIVARGGEGSDSHCLSLLNEVTKVWAETVGEHSPGTKYETGYLSRKQLTEHREKIQFYSESEVNEVKARGPSAAVKKVTGNEELVESLQDLMVFPPPSTSTSERCKQDVSDEVGARLVTAAQLEAIAKIARDKWLEVGLALKFEMVELDDYEERESKSLERRLLRLLHDWKAKVDYPTVNALVTACTTAGIGGAVKRELGLIHFN